MVKTLKALWKNIKATTITIEKKVLTNTLPKLWQWEALEGREEPPAESVRFARVSGRQ